MPENLPRPGGVGARLPSTLKSGTTGEGRRTAHGFPATLLDAVPEGMEPIREDVGAPESVDGRELKAPVRSALTRWLAQRQAAERPVSSGPSYERCQERSCWGKATWTCPRCQAKACSPHRIEHTCALPYLPS